MLACAVIWFILGHAGEDGCNLAIMCHVCIHEHVRQGHFGCMATFGHLCMLIESAVLNLTSDLSPLLHHHTVTLGMGSGHPYIRMAPEFCTEILSNCNLSHPKPIASCSKIP